MTYTHGSTRARCVREQSLSKFNYFISTEKSGFQQALSSTYDNTTEFACIGTGLRFLRDRDEQSWSSLFLSDIRHILTYTTMVEIARQRICAVSSLLSSLFQFPRNATHPCFLNVCEMSQQSFCGRRQRYARSRLRCTKVSKPDRLFARESQRRRRRCVL